MKKITLLLFAVALSLQVMAQTQPAKKAGPAKAKTSTTKGKATKAAPAAKPSKSLPFKNISTVPGFGVYKVVEGTGEQIVLGSNAEIHMDIVNYKDSLLGSSRQMGKPFSFKVGPAKSQYALENALLMMRVGDSALVAVNSDKYFAENGGEQNRPPFIPKGTDITYRVKIYSIVDMNKLAKENEAKVEAFINERKLTTTKYDNGLRVAMLREGTGEFPKNGDNVTVHYRGTLLDGTQFDASYDRNQPFTFKVGSRQVIMGWEEGIPKIKVGGKGILIIPSELGYGERGAGGSIPPNATLVFEVEVLETKPADK
ncbi:MAG: FKBP-type peptidyl-prolyl cis-trans isomerase [Flexibacteraceae bacterium]